MATEIQTVNILKNSLAVSRLRSYLTYVIFSMKFQICLKKRYHPLNESYVYPFSDVFFYEC